MTYRKRHGALLSFSEYIIKDSEEKTLLYSLIEVDPESIERARDTNLKYVRFYDAWKINEPLLGSQAFTSRFN